MSTATGIILLFHNKVFSISPLNLENFGLNPAKSALFPVASDSKLSSSTVHLVVTCLKSGDLISNSQNSVLSVPMVSPTLATSSTQRQHIPSTTVNGKSYTNSAASTFIRSNNTVPSMLLHGLVIMLRTNTT